MLQRVDFFCNLSTSLAYDIRRNQHLATIIIPQLHHHRHRSESINAMMMIIFIESQTPVTHNGAAANLSSGSYGPEMSPLDLKSLRRFNPN